VAGDSSCPKGQDASRLLSRLSASRHRTGRSPFADARLAGAADDLPFLAPAAQLELTSIDSTPRNCIGQSLARNAVSWIAEHVD
jgi:hypothetical protein